MEFVNYFKCPYCAKQEYIETNKKTSFVACPQCKQYYYSKECIQQDSNNHTSVCFTVLNHGYLYPDAKRCLEDLQKHLIKNGIVSLPV